MTAISGRGLYKIFGKNPKTALEALKNGSTREDLRQDGATAAVIDADFEVQRGEIFVVMGLSGSGKSTLLRLVNGLMRPTSGEIEVMGTILGEIKKKELIQLRRSTVSMVFQNFALLPHRTVGENAAYGLEIQGINKKDREARALEALEIVGLKGWEKHRPDELSGGMRQRVGLARALAVETEILLMDEAFSALDPLIRREMQDQLIDLQDQFDKTILFITHDLNEAMRLGDHVAMMRDGRIEQIGTPEEILNEPANEYVAQFVQDVDRTRVLYASDLMEEPPVTVELNRGVQYAKQLVESNETPWLLVVREDETPVGIIWDEDITAAVEQHDDDLVWSATHETPVVSVDTPMSELFAHSAEHQSPLVVVDSDGRAVGVIPREILLSAMDQTDYYNEDVEYGYPAESITLPNPAEEGIKDYEDPPGLATIVDANRSKAEPAEQTQPSQETETQADASQDDEQEADK